MRRSKYAGATNALVCVMHTPNNFLKFIISFIMIKYNNTIEKTEK
jgi:hypothetical protein